MFPTAKGAIDYNYNDEDGMPFAEWRRNIFEIDKWVLVGPQQIQAASINMDQEMLGDRQEKYDKYVADKEAGKPALYFRNSKADPRTIDFTKLPPVTLTQRGGSYDIQDGAHRTFLAKMANAPLMAYIWKSAKNNHPNVAKIKAMFSGAPRHS